jgi:cytochrome c-type biogenesis protein CcmF
MALLFIGVAASSSFQHASELSLVPGQSTRLAGYRIHYVRPTATITPREDAAHTGSTLALGAVLDVSRDGHHVATLRPSQGYYASGEAAQGSVGQLIGGQAVSHISMSAGITRDVWTAIAPDISSPPLARIVSAGNRTLSPDEALFALGFLARAYLSKPPPAQFHLIVSPLVMWIWIGGLTVLGGALIAIWPAPSALRRRALGRARVRPAGELARA